MKADHTVLIWVSYACQAGLFIVAFAWIWLGWCWYGIGRHDNAIICLVVFAMTSALGALLYCNTNLLLALQ